MTKALSFLILFCKVNSSAVGSSVDFFFVYVGMKLHFTEFLLNPKLSEMVSIPVNVGFLGLVLLRKFFPGSQSFNMPYLKFSIAMLVSL